MTSLRKNLIVVPSDTSEPNQVKERVSLFNPDGSPFSGGVPKIATISLVSPMTLIPTGGTPGVNEKVYNLGGYDHASFPWAVSDPDGILNANLAVDGEVPIVSGGTYSIDITGQSNSAGGAVGSSECQIWSYNYATGPTKNFFGYRRIAANGTIYFGCNGLIYISDEEALTNQVFGWTYNFNCPTGTLGVTKYEISVMKL